VRPALVLTPLVAVALAASLTCCKSFSGIDPMTEDGWEQVPMPVLGSQAVHTARFFVKYRDAEREGSIATVWIRYEGFETKATSYRSELMRVQFDCAKHMNRTLTDTVYQNNNLKGKSSPGPYVSSRWGTAHTRSTFDILITPVCARTAPQSAEVK
jgi:hypothetical protein